MSRLFLVMFVCLSYDIKKQSYEFFVYVVIRCRICSEKKTAVFPYDKEKTAVKMVFV